MKETYCVNCTYYFIDRDPKSYRLYNCICRNEDVVGRNLVTGKINEELISTTRKRTGPICAGYKEGEPTIIEDSVTILFRKIKTLLNSIKRRIIDAFTFFNKKK